MVRANKNHNTSLKLSIRVSLDGLSFCIANTKSKKIVFYKNEQFEQQLNPAKVLLQIEQQYEQEEELKQPIKEVKLIFSNQLYALVPSQLFDEENAANYLKYNTKILKTDFIAHDALENYAITNVYIPYANITNYFFDKYGEYEYKHSISILIESLLDLPLNKQPKIFINTKVDTFDLVVIENGELLLCNSFSYETPEDFLYYVLFTAEQLNISPLHFELVFLGSIDKDSSLYNLTYKYVKNISIRELSSSEHFDGSFSPSKSSEDFVLLNSL